MPFAKRRFETRFRQLLKQFPVVCILGARQCGKTTFAKMSLPGWRYFDLEKPSDVSMLSDPEEALNRWPQKVVFDEAQRFPGLFPALRSAIDEKRSQKGRFVLLGSASFELIRGISESLAGRVGFLDMTPFLLKEVGSLTHLWFRGGFPEAFLMKNDELRANWFEGYTRTFIERDLGVMGVDVSSVQMRRLCGMLAHVHGGLWNASEIAGSIGFNYHTANRYLDILEQTFLVRRLAPFHANIGKRLVKTPKVYFRDTGLLHYFLGLKTEDDLHVHPKRGWSWEGFVIEQIFGALTIKVTGAEFYFYRTSTGDEADLLIKRGDTLIPIEIKLHSSPKLSDVKGLVTAMKDLKCQKGLVIRPRGEAYPLSQGIEVLSLEQGIETIIKALA